jgi:hypothetical protein
MMMIDDDEAENIKLFIDDDDDYLIKLFLFFFKFDHDESILNICVFYYEN